jgi:peptidoglycan/LPS O-acetylase OafA/YrhL
MRFRALDGLRGLCALTVALLHLYDHLHMAAPSFVANSFALVDFFFVLSGFVLAHAFFEDLAANGQGGLFALRRIGRLYPLHFFILMLFLLVELGRWLAWRHGAAMLAQPFTAETSPGSLFTNLLLLQSMNLHDRITWNFPSWSISVEFYTNLVFALVMVLPSRAGAPLDEVLRRKTWGAAILALVGGILTVWASSQDMVMTYDDGFARCVYGFFCGVLAQRLRASGRDPLRALPRPVVFALEVGVTVAIVAFVNDGGKLWLFGLSPLAFAVAALVYAREEGPLSRLLLTRPFLAIGEWSYSIYMVHAFLLVHILGRMASIAGKHGWMGLDPASGADGGLYLADIFNKGPFAAGALILVYVAAVLVFSSQTFRFVEKPARRYFNDYAARKAALRRSAAEAPTLDAPAGGAPA